MGKIRAVRIGFVVQGEQFDKAKYDADVLTPPTWTLFDSAANRFTDEGEFRYRDVRNDDPTAQPSLESRGMKHAIRIANTRPSRRHRQRGVVMFIALIVMVALSLAAIALVRSVDTTNAIVGNLSFRMASILPGNLGVEKAAAALFQDADIASAVRIPDHNADCAAENYFASRQPGEDARGIPLKLQKKAELPVRGPDAPTIPRPEHRDPLRHRAHVHAARRADGRDLRAAAAEIQSWRHRKRGKVRIRRRPVLPRDHPGRRPAEHGIILASDPEVAA